MFMLELPALESVTGLLEVVPEATLPKSTDAGLTANWLRFVSADAVSTVPVKPQPTLKTRRAAETARVILRRTDVLRTGGRLRNQT
jgi:hypothetical protein